MFIQTKMKSNLFRKSTCYNTTGANCIYCSGLIQYGDKCYKYAKLGLHVCLDCKPAKQTKYHNTPKHYNGHTYQSKKEADFAKQLDILLQAGEAKSWERQVKCPLYAYGKFIANYYVDFMVVWADDQKEYIEIKSDVTETELWRLKWKIFQAQCEQTEPLSKLTVIK